MAVVEQVKYFKPQRLDSQALKAAKSNTKTIHPEDISNKLQGIQVVFPLSCSFLVRKVLYQSVMHILLLTDSRVKVEKAERGSSLGHLAPWESGDRRKTVWFWILRVGFFPGIAPDLQAKKYVPQGTIHPFLACIVSDNAVDLGNWCYDYAIWLPLAQVVVSFYWWIPWLNRLGHKYAVLPWVHQEGNLYQWATQSASSKARPWYRRRYKRGLWGVV